MIELPEPDHTTPVQFGSDGVWYRADQLRAYADACVAEERARLRGYFDVELADHKTIWPAEVDILYEKCFGKPK